MLSENELVELLDQLKLGALHGVVSETDPVGHWPVLVGDGLCLSLQSAARDEFASQPDKITVVDGISGSTTLSAICSCYWQVHHVSTGLHNRSILIGYDRSCLEIFSLLHDTGQIDVDIDEVKLQSGAAYDFSLAVAASLDPAAHLDGIDHPVAFLPIEFEPDTRLAGGWRISIDAFGKQGEFFIGLLNPFAKSQITGGDRCAIEAEIFVKPKTVSRLADSNTLSVTFSAPEQMSQHFPSRVQIFELELVDHDLVGKPLAITQQEMPVADLMVQMSLELTADDLYLLLVEAIGVGSALRLRFDSGMDNPQECCLRSGCRLRCLSVNNLPIKNAELYFSGGELAIFVKE